MAPELDFGHPRGLVESEIDEAPMVSIPARVRDVFCEWSDEFSGSVWPRFQVLVFAAIVCVGRHTVCRLLRIAGTLAQGHWSNYHRVLSKRRWSTWHGEILTRVEVAKGTWGGFCYWLMS